MVRLHMRWPTFLSCLTLPVLLEQSEVEETIERIKHQGGVEGYVICNRQGQVLRRMNTVGQSQEIAEKYAQSMMTLATQARGVVRDLNPKVCVMFDWWKLLSVFKVISLIFQNELRYLRVRAKRHEIMVAYGKQS